MRTSAYIAASLFLISLTACQDMHENPDVRKMANPPRDNGIQAVEGSQANGAISSGQNPAPPLPGAPGYGSGPGGPARP